jgi:hypothetical protein
MNLSYSTKRLLRTSKEQIFMRDESNSASNGDEDLGGMCEQRSSITATPITLSWAASTRTKRGEDLGAEVQVREAVRSERGMCDQVTLCLLLTREERIEKEESNGTYIRILSSLLLAAVADSPSTRVTTALSLALDFVLLVLFQLQALV